LFFVFSSLLFAWYHIAAINYYLATLLREVRKKWQNFDSKSFSNILPNSLENGASCQTTKKVSVRKFRLLLHAINIYDFILLLPVQMIVQE
jgi:hypothetical protein